MNKNKLEVELNSGDKIILTESVTKEFLDGLIQAKNELDCIWSVYLRNRKKIFIEPSKLVYEYDLALDTRAAIIVSILESWLMIKKIIE